MDNINENNYLILKRFCGDEKYPVVNAEWYISKGDGTWDDPYMLCLEIEFGKGIEMQEDTAEWYTGEPGWEVYFPTLNLKEEDLGAGFTLEIEKPDEHAEAYFLYEDRQPTFDNKVEVLKVEENRLLIHLTAKTKDVNYYDVSKPMNVLDVMTWVEKQD